MILDPNKYKLAFPTIKRLYERDIVKPGKDQATIISELSLSTSVPVLAVVLYVQREFGTSEALEKSIISLISFYYYDKVIPVSDNTGDIFRQ